MADEKNDMFATVLPNEKPAYPQWIHLPTGHKYGNGADICTSHLVKDVAEHKALLDEKGISYPGQAKEAKDDKKKAGWDNK